MQVDLASAFSAGLLAGAALGVILPEGFGSFSRAQAEGQCQAVHAHMRLSEGLTPALVHLAQAAARTHWALLCSIPALLASADAHIKLRSVTTIASLCALNCIMAAPLHTLCMAGW